MDQEQPFRLVLIVGALVIFPIVAYHRVRSQMTGEKLDRWQEGRFILFTLRPLGLITFAGTIAYMIDPSNMAWSSIDLPKWLRWTGAVFLAMSAALFAWTLPNLGKNLTDTVVTRHAHTLVLSGPYRWVRHPFYGALALFVFGNGLVMANWLVLVSASLLMMVIVLRTRREEDNLIARFGDDYRHYIARTGRFLP